MARVRKPQPTFDSVFFATPEQKVIRLLLSEPTSALTPRLISSKLKGVRGMGGNDGINKILAQLKEIGLLDFVDNQRAVRLEDDNPTIQLLKRFSAVCDLESLRKLLEPVSSKGILFGSRSTGRARTDSDYDLFVVTDAPDQVRDIAGSHPLGKAVEVVAWTTENYGDIENQDARLARKLEAGIVLWGSSW